ncbi:VOC family protein [Nocardia heshunensis]
MGIHYCYTPVRVGIENFERSVAYYADVFGEPCRLHFRYETGGLDIATVGRVVVVGGSERDLAAAPRQDLVAMVDSLERWRAGLPAGTTVVQEPADIPTGRNILVRNPDGTLFEYVELDPARVAAVNLAAVGR